MKLPVLHDFPPPTTPGESLYAPPNLDGSGKLCSNCALFLSKHMDGGTRCMIHAPDLEVRAEQVCGYHVFGRPRHHTGLDVEEFVTPELSGLIDAPPGGTHCANCYFFAPPTARSQTGACGAVASEVGPSHWRPAEVHRNGCCSRWRSTAK